MECSLPEGLCPVEKTRTRGVHEELQLWEEHLEQFMKACSPWKRPQAGTREKREGNGREELLWSESSLFPIFLALFGVGGEVEESRMKK